MIAPAAVLILAAEAPVFKTPTTTVLAAVHTDHAMPIPLVNKVLALRGFTIIVEPTVAPVTVRVNCLVVPVGMVALPSLYDTLVLTMFDNTVPDAPSLKVPPTSNLAVGTDAPMPMLPSAEITVNAVAALFLHSVKFAV